MDTKKQASAIDYIANGGLTAFAGALPLVIAGFLLDEGTTRTALAAAGIVVIGVGLLIVQVGIIAKGIEVAGRERR